MTTEIKITLPAATPYRLDDDGDIIGWENGHEWLIAQTMGSTVERAVATGKFLVRSANAHEELVACLLAYVEIEESAAPYASSPMRERARAIIGKAIRGAV